MSDYSSTYPTQSPVFAFDAKAGKLDSRISFSRSDTPPTYAAPSAVHYWSNEKHLSSENLLLQSQDFDTSPWSNFNLASSNGLTGGQTAPDGTSTAWLVTGGVSSDSTSTPSVYMDLFGTAAGMVQPNSQNTYVMHVKAGTATHAWVTVRGDSANYVAAVLDFSNTSSLTTYQSGWTLDSSTVTALGNSWYRIALTFTSNSAVNFGQVYVGPTNSNTLTTYYPQWPFNGETMYAWGAQLSSTNSKVYDSPTTTQISRSYSSTIKSVANAGDPRFEFDASGNAKGLLVESQSSNLAIYSDDVSNWGGSTGIISGAQANACVGPTGSMAYAIVEPTIANTHYASINVSGQDYSAAYTASVYIKKLASGSGTKQVKLRINGMGGQAYAAFDLDSGAVVQEAGTTFNSATISSVSNGWYRISMTYTNQAADRATGMLLVLSNGDSASLPNYTGDGYTAYGVANFQFEKSSFPSSPISTSGASATRAADSCSVVDATLFSSGEHTIIWEGDTDPTSSDKRFFALSDGSMSNRFVADYDNGVATRLRNWADGATNVNMSTSTVDMTVGTHKLAATLKTNESQLVIDGTRRQVDTSCVVGSGIDQLAINSSTTGAGTVYNMNGHCKRITYFNVALSQTEAEALTSNP